MRNPRVVSGFCLPGRRAQRGHRLMPTDTSPPALDTGQETPPRRHHIDKRAGALAAEIAAGGDPDELLSDSQLAELSGLSVQFFQIGRVKGYAPPSRVPLVELE